MPDGARAGPRRHALVAAQERRAQRQVHAQQRRQAQGRPRRVGRGVLNEQAYDVIDELERIAKELETHAARVALAWVQARRAWPRRSSARARWSSSTTTSRALDVRLTAEELAALDELTAPTLDFPADMLPMAPPSTTAAPPSTASPRRSRRFVMAKGDKPYTR